MTTATASRTDVHRPGSPDFDPQAYRLIDVYDLHVESGDHRFLNEKVRELAAQGIVQGGNVHAACGHCGQTNVRYVALLVRDDVSEWIFVGQDCLAGRFLSQTKASFAELRKAAELERQKQAVKAAWSATLEQYPDLVWATYADNWSYNPGTWSEDRQSYTTREGYRPVITTAKVDWELSTLSDIVRKSRRYGGASERQAVFVTKLVRKVEERYWAAVAELDDPQPEPEVPPAPEGKVVVEGVIVHTEWRESAYGGSLKMIVKADEGWKVWSTLPASLTGADKGDRVRFTATLTRSDRDQGFAFASRPTKGLVLALAENE